MNIAKRVPLKIDVEKILSMCGGNVVKDVITAITEYNTRYAKRLEVQRRFRRLHGSAINARKRLKRKLFNAEVTAKQRAYREANKDRINAYNREYNRLHNAEITAGRRARYAAKKAAKTIDKCDQTVYNISTVEA